MNEDFDLSRFMLLVKNCSSFFDGFLNKIADGMDISAPEARTLLLLNDNPELDSAFKIVNSGPPVSKSYVSKAVSGLASKKLITLTKDENDKRIQHIKLTEAAEPIIKQLSEARDRLICFLVEEVTEEEKDLLTSIMKKVEEKAKKLKSLT
ncbi:MAG: hypothetical protein J6N52_11200 [Clostridia bacterium]|nr:hypothetical protein [Clostridia bacterium]